MSTLMNIAFAAPARTAKGHIVGSPDALVDDIVTSVMGSSNPAATISPTNISAGFGVSARAQDKALLRQLNQFMPQLTDSAQPASSNSVAPVSSSNSSVGANPKTTGKVNQGLPVNSQGFIHPLGGKGTVTGVHGENRGSHRHAGTDWAAPEGTPIYAVKGGTVTRIQNDPNGYGVYFDVTDKNGKVHRYAHLPNTKYVELGQKVEQGQQIAEVGNTGRSTGPHLHYEIRKPGAPAFGFSGTLDPRTLVG